jgi:hypothetical protein
MGSMPVHDVHSEPNRGGIRDDSGYHLCESMLPAFTMQGWSLSDLLPDNRPKTV